MKAAKIHGHFSLLRGITTQMTASSWIRLKPETFSVEA
jgi:hypothetical protein